MYTGTQDAIDALTSEYYSPYHPPHGDSFGENITTSDRFLMSSLLSFLLGIFFWQPLILLFFAWLINCYYSGHPQMLHEGLFFLNDENLVDIDVEKIELAQMKAQQHNASDNRDDRDNSDSDDDLDQDVVNYVSPGALNGEIVNPNDENGANNNDVVDQQDSIEIEGV